MKEAETSFWTSAISSPNKRYTGRPYPPTHRAKIQSTEPPSRLHPSPLRTRSRRTINKAVSNRIKSSKPPALPLPIHLRPLPPVQLPGNNLPVFLPYAPLAPTAPLLLTPRMTPHSMPIMHHSRESLSARRIRHIGVVSDAEFVTQVLGTEEDDDNDVDVDAGHEDALKRKCG